MPIIRFTIKVNGVLTDPTSIVLADPSGTYGVKRNDDDDVVVAENTPLTQVSTGVYQYQFDDPAPGLSYGYFVKYVLNGATYYSEDEIAGEAASFVKTLTEMKADVLAILEDPNGQIFEDEPVTKAINQALKFAAWFVPAESKEERTFTSGSRQINISDIEGFIQLDPGHPAEYPIGRYPPQYRNASVFNRTVTVETSRTPAEGDKVYLYAQKHHILTDAVSTLPLELEPFIADYAAGQLALNWLGTGRQQIRTSIYNIDSVSSTFDDIESWLSGVTTAIGSMTAEVSGMEAVAGAGETDLQSARDAITSSISNFDTKLSEIGDQVSLARNDIGSGRALVNTISNGLNPENDYFQAAMGELNTLSNILTQASMELSQMQAGSIYTGIASREQMAGGLYSQAADVYGREVSAQLAGANLRLSKTGAQLRQAASRLNAANLMIGYTKWAQGKIAAAEKGMRDLQRPRTRREWGED